MPPMSMVDLARLSVRLEDPRRQEELADMWTDPTTIILFDAPNSGHPDATQTMIMSQSVGALRLRDLGIGHTKPNTIVVCFHGNRLCRVLMDANAECRPVVEALLFDADVAWEAKRTKIDA